MGRAAHGQMDGQTLLHTLLQLAFLSKAPPTPTPEHSQPAFTTQLWPYGFAQQE